MLEFCERYRPYLKTKTQDTSEYGVQYVSGLLRLESERRLVNIARKTEVEPQNMHHFMSNSPWSERELIKGVQEEISQRSEFRTGGMLLVDESADEKTGPVSVGSKRQHNGRLGKIKLSQVRVFASLATAQANTWVDGALFIPEDWFGAKAVSKREKVGLPEELTFKTKPQLAWELIQRAKENGLPFDAVGMDTLYGRNRQLRADLDQAEIEYYADVPASTKVYLNPRQLVYGRTKKENVSKTRLSWGGLTLCETYSIHLTCTGNT